MLNTPWTPTKIDRYAVISVPDILQIGLAAPLLFFDKIVVPDLEYVEQALYEIAHPEVFSTPFDTDVSETVGEVRLGLGHRLWPYSLPADFTPTNWTKYPETVIRELAVLEQRGVVTPVSRLNVYTNRHFNSFEASRAMEQLDEQRIQIALQIATKDYADVCTVRHRPDEISLASIPTKLDKSHVVRFVMKQVPIPSEEVKLDEILDFRNDSNAQAELYRLRTWMSKAVNDYGSIANLEDEYRATYEDYKKAIGRLSRKFNTSIVGIAAAVGVEIVDNLAQLKFGSAVKALFDWRSVAMEFEKETDDAPGRELAYVKRIENTFHQDISQS